jgi:hypothetical protein
MRELAIAPRAAELGEPVRVIEVEPAYSPVPSDPGPFEVEPAEEPTEAPA